MTSRGRSGVWLEARALLWRQRRELDVGLGLGVVNRLAALAVPTASNCVIDDVIGRSSSCATSSLSAYRRPVRRRCGRRWWQLWGAER
jgi:hypothetical protein